MRVKSVVAMCEDCGRKYITTKKDAPKDECGICRRRKK